MLGGQQQAIGEQAGAALQGALGRNPGKLRKIIAFREMRQNYISGLAVVGGGKELGGGLVGEVADTGKHALFHRPGVRAVAQHLQIVVRFEQQQVDALELGLDVGRNVAQVGSKGHPHSLT